MERIVDELPEDLERLKTPELLAETREVLKCFSSGSLTPIDFIEEEEEVKEKREENETEEGTESEDGDGIDSEEEEEFLEFFRERKEEEIREWLMEREELISLVNENGDGLLHLAIKHSLSLALVKFLLRMDADVGIKNSLGLKAVDLLEIVESEGISGDSHRIKELLVSWEGRLGDERNELIRLAQQGDFKALDEFIEEEETDQSGNSLSDLVNQIDDRTGFAPVHEAAARNHHRLIKSLYKYYSIDLNLQSRESGNTALHESIRMVNVDAVRVLLELGADMKVLNNSGKVAIEEIEGGQGGNEEEEVTAIRKLWDRSSKRSISNGSLGGSVSISASSDLQESGNHRVSREERKLQQILGYLDKMENSNASGSGSGSTNPISTTNNDNKKRGRPRKNSVGSASEGDDDLQEEIETILQRDKATGRTILHRFASRNRVDRLLRFIKETRPLLMRTLSIGDFRVFDAADNAGYTALHEAALQGHVDFAKMLIYGPEGIPIKHRFDRWCSVSPRALLTGDTPLHDAASSNDSEMIGVLVEAGADRFVKNRNDKRPVDVCEDEECRRILETGIISNEQSLTKTNISSSLLNNGKSKVKKIKEKLMKEVGLTSTSSNNSNQGSPTRKVKNDKDNSNSNNNNSIVPVKRGPGRPRKYPRPDETGTISTIESTGKRETEIEGNNDVEGGPSIKASKRVSVDIGKVLPGKMLILVKLGSGRDPVAWYFLANQLLPLLGLLFPSPKSLQFPSETLNDPDRLRILHLPTNPASKLVPLLKEQCAASDSIGLIAKNAVFGALGGANWRYLVQVTEFGYVDVPKMLLLRASTGKITAAAAAAANNSTGNNNISTNNTNTSTSTSVSTGACIPTTLIKCPLKLKMKLSRLLSTTLAPAPAPSTTHSSESGNGAVVAGPETFQV